MGDSNLPVASSVADEEWSTRIALISRRLTAVGSIDAVRIGEVGPVDVKSEGDGDVIIVGMRWESDN